jgi:hypothetical protein
VLVSALTSFQLATSSSQFELLSLRGTSNFLTERFSLIQLLNMGVSGLTQYLRDHAAFTVLKLKKCDLSSNSPPALKMVVDGLALLHFLRKLCRVRITFLNKLVLVPRCSPIGPFSFLLFSNPHSRKILVLII